MPAPTQASRYPPVNPASRRARQERTDRWYIEATGATEGSIIAAIINPHMPTKAGRLRPMVPVMPTIVPARPAVTSQATAATSSSTAACGVRRRSDGAALVVMPPRRRAPSGRSCRCCRTASPKALTREAVALAMVRVELAGWNMPVSFSTGPSGVWGGTKSSTVMSTSSPILTRWRRPSSTYSIGALWTPSISVISGASMAMGPPSCPAKTAPSFSACSWDAAASMNTPTRQFPSAISGGVSASTATVRSLTSTSSTLPASTWKTSTTRHRS